MHILERILRGWRKPSEEEGQTLVEYGLLLALISIIIVVALLFLGPIVSGLFQNVGTSINRV